MKSRLLVSALALFSFHSFGQSPIPKLGSYEFLNDGPQLQNIREYQLGDEWGKTPATEEVMQKSAALRRAAMATARVGGGTGFVLGEFDGQIVIATNHHVCPAYYYCDRGVTQLPNLNLRLSYQDFIGSWPDIDLALYVVSASGEARNRLLAVAQNFDFDSAIETGQPLITSGFGVAGNSNRQMMINFDSDCRVLSGTNEFRLMNDPDEKNPASYRAWSFANGCDVSHGDSGSAMVDARTGAPVGIIWTGKIPKNLEAQSSAQLKTWEAEKSEKVWTEVSYAVPAAKIREFLRAQLSKNKIDPEHRAIVADIVD